MLCTTAYTVPHVVMPSLFFPIPSCQLSLPNSFSPVYSSQFLLPNYLFLNPVFCVPSSQPHVPNDMSFRVTNMLLPIIGSQSLVSSSSFPESRPQSLLPTPMFPICSSQACLYRHLLSPSTIARTTAQILQMHQGYSDLMKGLVEKLTQDHTTSVGITDSAFVQPLPAPAEGQPAGAAPPHLKSHADLRYAVALLLLAAEALPEQDVEFTVCRLLFNQAIASCTFQQLQLNYGVLSTLTSQLELRQLCRCCIHLLVV